MYWRTGPNIIILRSEAKEVLQTADVTVNSSEPHPIDNMPWVSYKSFDVAKVYITEAAFTRGAKPVPASLLPAHRSTKIAVGNRRPAAFTVPANNPAEGIWRVGIGAIHAIGWMLTPEILVPGHTSSLNSPLELGVWAFFFELAGQAPNTEDDHTDGLPKAPGLFRLFAKANPTPAHGKILDAVKAGDSAPPGHAVRIEIVSQAGEAASSYDSIDVFLGAAGGADAPF